MSSKRIWKYPLRTTDRQEVEMPAGASILHVGVQDGTVCLWAMVEPPTVPGGSDEERTIWIVGTGNPVPDEVLLHSNHLGTVQQGPFVWHVYEQWEDPA